MEAHHEEKKIYIYPVYFDSNKKCSEGRRVPRTVARSNPQISDILSAAKASNLFVELENDKSHPKSDAKSGRITVTIKETSTKNSVISEIAKHLKTSPASNSSSSNIASPITSSTVEISPNQIMKIRSKKKGARNK